MAKYQGRRGVQGNFRGKVEGVQQKVRSGVITFMDLFTVMHNILNRAPTVLKMITKILAFSGYMTGKQDENLTSEILDQVIQLFRTEVEKLTSESGPNALTAEIAKHTNGVTRLKLDQPISAPVQHVDISGDDEELFEGDPSAGEEYLDEDEDMDEDDDDDGEEGY